MTSVAVATAVAVATSEVKMGAAMAAEKEANLAVAGLHARRGSRDACSDCARRMKPRLLPFFLPVTAMPRRVTVAVP